MMRNVILFTLIFFVSWGLNAQSLTAITPNSSLKGQYLTVAITGSGTSFSQGSSTVWLSQGSSTIWGSSSPLSNTQLSAGFSIPAYINCGNYDLHTSNLVDGHLILPNSFLVKCPVITNVNPNGANPGDNLSVLITAQNTDFTQGSSTVFLYQGSSTIAPFSVSSQEAQSLNTFFQIPINADCGSYTVVVTNNQGYFEKANGFEICYNGVQSTEFNSNITFSPNPFKENTTLKISAGFDEALQLKIFDLSGNEVRAYENVHDNLTIRRDDLNAGFYIYLIAGKSQTAAGRLLIVD